MKLFDNHRLNIPLILIGIFLLIMSMVSVYDDIVDIKMLFLLLMSSLLLGVALVFIQNKAHTAGVVLQLTICLLLVLLGFQVIKISPIYIQATVAFSKFFGSTIIIFYGLNILQSVSRDKG